MSEYEIKGLTKSETIESPPEAILERRRTTGYDRLLEDAKTKTIKLVLENDKRAINVHLALRLKIRRNKLNEKVSVGRTNNKVYVFPAKLIKK
jgi:hypothetical protein